MARNLSASLTNSCSDRTSVRGLAAGLVLLGAIASARVQPVYKPTAVPTAQSGVVATKLQELQLAVVGTSERTASLRRER